jgi:hypothetical protein
MIKKITKALFGKNSLIATALLLTTGFAPFAQPGSVTGKLTDEKGAAVPNANIVLLKQPGNHLAGGSTSAADGKFSIRITAAGSFLLRVNALGFAEFKTEIFVVGDSTTSKEMGMVLLKTEVKQLQDVSVNSLRPAITQKADRMVVNIEGTAMAAGSTAYSVLAKIPGVFIDQDGNIQLNGRAGVTVMIDGKLTYLSAADLRNMLEGMSAENIKNIEIITNPSAKYDAQGSSGMLNINLKKNDRQGINGSVYAGYSGNFLQDGFSGGGNINYKNGRWNSFLTTDLARRFGGREATFTRIFYGTKTTYFDQTANSSYKVTGPPTIRLGSDYSFNDKHSVGFIFSMNNSNSKEGFFTRTNLGDAPSKPVQYIAADNYQSSHNTRYAGNLHYSGKLDTVGMTLSADLDYVKIRNHSSSDFNNFYTTIATGQTTKDLLYTDVPNGYDIYAGKIDFALPFHKDHEIDRGIKASHVFSDNDSRFYFNNGSLVPDPQRTNHFKYSENIFAAYFLWAGQVSKKLLLQAGLRAEETSSRGESVTTGQITDRKYLDLFPSAFIQHKVSDNYGINYSYSRRLSRPNYGSLNPFRSYRDPYTWSEGNPNLRPQYTHAFSITQTFRKKYNLVISYQLTKDAMMETPVLDVANATTIYTTGNLDDAHNMSITGIVPIRLSGKWESQNTFVVSYSKFSTLSNNGLVVNEQLSYLFQSNHTILLPWGLRLEVNATFRGPSASGLYHMAPMSRVDLGLKKSFFNKKLDLTLNANDIYKGYRFLWTTNINGNINDFDQYLRWRTVGVTLRYNFSSGQKVDLKKRNTNLDELNRAGN